MFVHQTLCYEVDKRQKGWSLRWIEERAEGMWTDVAVIQLQDVREIISGLGGQVPLDTLEQEALFSSRHCGLVGEGSKTLNCGQLLEHHGQREDGVIKRILSVCCRIVQLFGNRQADIEEIL